MSMKNVCDFKHETHLMSSSCCLNTWISIFAVKLSEQKYALRYSTSRVIAVNDCVSTVLNKQSLGKPLLTFAGVTDTSITILVPTYLTILSPYKHAIWDIFFIDMDVSKVT